MTDALRTCPAGCGHVMRPCPHGCVCHSPMPPTLCRTTGGPESPPMTPDNPKGSDVSEENERKSHDPRRCQHCGLADPDEVKDGICPSCLVERNPPASAGVRGSRCT